jgi:hypothetical protein
MAIKKGHPPDIESNKTQIMAAIKGACATIINELIRSLNLMFKYLLVSQKY